MVSPIILAPDTMDLLCIRMFRTQAEPAKSGTPDARFLDFARFYGPSIPVMESPSCHFLLSAHAGVGGGNACSPGMVASD
jgi:hypothetical protein